MPRALFMNQLQIVIAEARHLLDPGPQEINHVLVSASPQEIYLRQEPGGVGGVYGAGGRVQKLDSHRLEAVQLAPVDLSGLAVSGNVTILGGRGPANACRAFSSVRVLLGKQQGSLKDSSSSTRCLGACKDFPDTYDLTFDCVRGRCYGAAEDHDTNKSCT